MQQDTKPSIALLSWALAVASISAVAGVVGFPSSLHAGSDDVTTLERRVAELSRQLEQAREELAEARTGAVEASAAEDAAAGGGEPDDAALAAEAQPSEESEAEPAEIRFGPLTVGGAVRVNYILGSYAGRGDGPSRGGHGGDFELDTFRINMSLKHDRLIGKLEYRWYNGYNFLHTGWLGYELQDASQIQVGVTRVPFGPGPYGVSQSWFFDQHYYVGLADDMDLGIKYVTERGNWDLDLAYFFSSEGRWRGTSEDSARYSYDAVRWRSGLDQNGNLIGAPVNGYEERNQFNLRAVYRFDEEAIPTDLGISLQYGQLRGTGTDDGDHWAASAHMINRLGSFTLASQLTRYEIHIDADNPLGTDALIPMGAYDFAWPVATKAWIPAASLSYRYDTPRIPWLDYVLPYLEYSNIVKDEGDFNDSQMWTLGAAWAHGAWYVYSDLVYSNGNYFVGDEGDDYANLFAGVGDFGVAGNDKWNYRFNINFGYYF
jgi:hypothetical protein